MSWDKIKEMNLYDKISSELKDISEDDSSRVEDYITSPEKLESFKWYIHEGYDSRSMGKILSLTVNQVDIIKELLGKL